MQTSLIAKLFANFLTTIKPLFLLFVQSITPLKCARNHIRALFVKHSTPSHSNSFFRLVINEFPTFTNASPSGNMVAEANTVCFRALF